MNVTFTKMHGLGNDFVMVQALGDAETPAPHQAWPDQLWRDLAIKVCDRHFGIGADGIIAILPPTISSADFRMRMFNPDGSEAQMCGNGIRCFARYVFERGLAASTEPNIETLAGLKRVQLGVVNSQVTGVRVNMGVPEFDAARIPTRSTSPEVKDYPLTIAGRTYEVSCVSMGNPHAVVFMSEVVVNALELSTLGPLFEHHELFPERTNTEFCAVLDRETVRMRVWERGAGETLACGTGACGAAAVAIDHGLAEHRVDIVLDGGRLNIEWQGRGEPVFMTGPAEYVCDGEYYYA